MGSLPITVSHYWESRNHPWVKTSTSIYMSVASIASLPVLYLWSFTWAKILQNECMSTGKHPLQTMIQRPICLITMSLRVGGLYISSSEKVCDVCASVGQTNPENLREELDCSACSNSKIKKNWSLVTRCHYHEGGHGSASGRLLTLRKLIEKKTFWS